MELKHGLPTNLAEIKFHGGDICYAWLPRADIPLEQQKEFLDRCLLEVSYPLGFMLQVGYCDKTGLADGHYPDGEFVVKIRNTETWTTQHEWHTRDVQTLYNRVREAATLAPKLRQTKNSES